MATYEIIIKNETDTQQSSAVAGESAGESSQGVVNKGKKLTEGQKKAAGFLVAYNALKPWISQTVSHQINTVELRTGRKEYAERTQFTYNIVNDVVGIGESALAGYAVGNLPGAVIGAIVGLGHTLLGYAQKQETINIQNSLENIVLQQNRIRAGVGGSRRV